ALRRPTGCVQSAVRASERDADEHRNRSQVGVATNAQRTRLGEHAQAAQPEADARTAGEAELRVRRIILREVRIEAHVVVAYTSDDVRLDHDEWHVEQHVHAAAQDVDVRVVAGTVPLVDAIDAQIGEQRQPDVQRALEMQTGVDRITEVARRDGGAHTDAYAEL